MNSAKRSTFVWGCVLCATVAVIGCALGRPGADSSQSDLYFGFTLIDPASEILRNDAFLVITDGRFSEVGFGEPPKKNFRTRRALPGRFALPGFVDAHAHITAGPHEVAIVNGAPAVTIESIDDVTQFNARMALAFGVTTVRNPAGDPVANARYDQNVRTGAWIGPEAVHAGAVIQPPPFVGSAFVYPRSDADWNAEARRQAGLGMKYFKLYVSLTEDELGKGIRAAHENGLRAIAHFIGITWATSIQLERMRGSSKPLAETTAAFLEFSIHDCRARRRGIAVAAALYAGFFSFMVAWQYRQLAAEMPLDVGTHLTSERVMTQCAITAVLGIIALDRRQRLNRELRHLTTLRQRLGWHGIRKQ